MAETASEGRESTTRRQTCRRDERGRPAEWCLPPSPPPQSSSRRPPSSGPQGAYFLSYSPAPKSTGWRCCGYVKLNYNLQWFRYHGFLNWWKAHHLMANLKFCICYLQRYGKPDLHFFGNPEIKNVIIWVFYDADAGSKVFLNFQGCYSFFTLINIMQNRAAFHGNCLRNIPCNFSVLKQRFPKHKENISNLLPDVIKLSN